MNEDTMTIALAGAIFCTILVVAFSFHKDADKKMYEMCAEVAESVEEYQECVDP